MLCDNHYQSSFLKSTLFKFYIICFINKMCWNKVSNGGKNFIRLATLKKKYLLNAIWTFFQIFELVCVYASVGQSIRLYSLYMRYVDLHTTRCAYIQQNMIINKFLLKKKKLKKFISIPLLCQKHIKYFMKKYSNNVCFYFICYNSRLDEKWIIFFINAQNE